MRAKCRQNWSPWQHSATDFQVKFRLRQSQAKIGFSQRKIAIQNQKTHFPALAYRTYVLFRAFRPIIGTISGNFQPPNRHLAAGTQFSPGSAAIAWIDLENSPLSLFSPPKNRHSHHKLTESAEFVQLPCISLTNFTQFRKKDISKTNKIKKYRRVAQPNSAKRKPANNNG